MDALLSDGPGPIPQQPMPAPVPQPPADPFAARILRQVCSQLGADEQPIPCHVEQLDRQTERLGTCPNIPL